MKVFIKPFVFLPFFLNLYSTEGIWSPLDITGGKVYMLAQSSSNSDILLAAGEMSVFRSTNGAESWVKVLPNIKPNGVAFSKSSPQTAYASSDYAMIYKSNDSGATWIRRGPEFNEQLFISICQSTLCVKANAGLAVDPGNSNIIYAAGEDLQDELLNSKDYSFGVFKNTNEGDFYSWTKIDSVSDGQISSLISPSANSFCYSVRAIGGEGGRIVCYKGENRYEYDDSGNLYEIYSLSFNPDNPSEIYASGDEMVLKSSDGGETWSELLNLPDMTPDPNKYFKIAVRGNNSLILCSGHYCTDTQDDGNNWSDNIEIDSTFANYSLSPYIQGNILYSKSDDKIYLYGDSAIYKGDGNPITEFSPSNKGLYNLAFYSLYNNPLNSSIIYAGSYSDIYITKDKGETWENIKIDELRYGITHNYNGIISRGDATYAAIAGNIYKTEDDGFSWNQINNSEIGNGNIGNLIAMIEDPNNTGTFYLGTGMSKDQMDGPGLYQSPNLGQDWSRVDFLNESTPTVTFIAISTIPPYPMYVVAFEDFANDENSHLYKSVDEDRSVWSKIESLDTAISGSSGTGWINSMQLDPDNNNILYVSNDWNLVKSTDSGNTWTKLYTSSGGGIKKFALFKTDNGGRIMYLGVDDKIYTSIDDGKNWILVGSGFNGTRAFARGSVFAGTSEGLYKAEISPITVSDTEDTIIITTSAYGSVFNIQIPPGAFPSGTFLFSAPFIPTTPSDSKIIPSKLGFNITTNTGSQPSKPITVKIKYNLADIPGLNEDKLTVLRLNESGSGYVVIETIIDKINKELTATIDHFSSFIVAQYNPLSTVPAPIAYPIPFNPKKHTAGMSIENIMPQSEAKIYTILGQLVRKIKADSNGKALWDGKNDWGREVASGIYVVLLKDQSNSTKKIKIAVER